RRPASELCYITGPDERSPSARFRVLPYLERFRADGLTATWRRLPRSRPARALTFMRLRGTPTVILQRVLLPGWQLRLLRGCVRTRVLDSDDAIIEGEGASAARRRVLRGRFDALLRAADGLVAGNRHLAACAEPRRGELLVLPTPVDTARFRPETRSNDVPVIVWSGTSASLGYLRAVVPALQALAARQRYRLRVVCDAPFLA